MSIFQKSIVNKYLKNLDNEKVNLAFKQFQTFYGNKLRLFEILHLKEENYQEGFLREIFVQALGYTLRPDLNYNLTTEYKNQTDSKKADGAIIKNNSAIGVIELKSTKTFNLDTIKNQAFHYKHNQPDCRYIITSNFHQLRFYIDNSTEYDEFDLFELTEQQFKVFYLLLSQESIFNNIPLKMKEESKFHEENISEKFYRDYKQLRDKIFNNLIKNNPQYDKLTLFKKTQKLLDRFIFIWFAEDCGLVAPNMIANVIQKWKNLLDNDEYFTLFSRFQKTFQYLNEGYTFQKTVYPAFNGGLFHPDEIIDNPNLKIDDNVLIADCMKISAYDFSTELDVNILGHIFEHSLNDIEEIAAELQGATVEKTKTKRKKDGVFYTPKYITNYIVDNTIGKLCKDKQIELQIADIEINETYNKNRKITKQGKELYKKLQEYKNWLLTLKILDPACGSGAFLNTALDFLIKQHQEIDDLISHLTGDKIRMFDTDKNILENNIFGVDLNEESVEIAKLSLWLRTAKKDRKLSDLNGNIKCGNSLIDNQDIAGEKAFDWKTEFAEIMKNGGFDVVIGNPPYVDSESMTRFNPKDRDFISKNYKTAKGNWDLYIPFIEKGIVLMKDTGYLSYITPNKWLSMPYGTELRKYVLDTIIQLSDFQKLKVFESASVFPITFSIRKETNNTLDIKIFNEKMEFVHYDLQKKDFNVSNFGFLLSKKIPILVNIKNQSHVLSQISDINGAFTTSEAYELIPYISNYEGQEKGTFLKLVNTGTIDKFTDLWDYEEVTYLKNKYVKPIVNIHDYKNKFQKRFQKYNNPKIIISGIRHFESFYDNNNEYLAGKSTTVLTNLKCYNYETITCILNSKLMEFYIKESYSTSGMDGGINFSPDLIRSLPIPVIDDVSLQKIKLLYDDLRIVYDNINKLKYNFAKIISSDFEISKPSGKIQKWYELNWNSFILEIKKLNGKLDKKKQLDWIDFFNENQNKIKHIINDSNCKIALINEFVYGLYNLSTEQILMLEDVS